MLQRGAAGPQVLALQQNLAAVLQVQLLEDGLFGPQTEAAVKAFQQLSGLPVTGMVDEETWQGLTGSPETAR